ncbi:MAG TPA: site-specific integrase [Thermoleophilaceae bacterium]|jgi:integrase
MARESTGGVLTRTLADGTRVFRLRFRAEGRRHDLYLHERPGCECGCGGGWDERGARTELGNVLARVRVGVWRPSDPMATKAEARQEIPTFREYAHEWLCGKLDGTLGDKALAANTATGYRGMLTGHLLPYFGRYRLDEIDRQLCLEFKARKVREAAELREAIEAGADIRDRRNRRRVPLSASTIRKLIGLLAAILDDAVEDELIERNPARGKRMRVRVPKPARSFLELDELAALIEAAAAQDALPPLPLDGETTRARVARRVAAGRWPKDIAAELGLSRSTVNFHLNRLGVDQRGGYVGRRAVVEVLGRSGVRASELCDLRIRDVRLHDRDGARFRIRDAKTAAGVREVQMSPDLVEAVVEHLDRLRRAGLPTGPDAYLVPNRRGGRLSRQRVGKVVGEAAALATERLSARGLPPLPHTTPHSLRRTYISIALLANNFDVKWVMSQVGHADSKMTLDVYAQLEQRIQRDNGAGFDRLVRAARAQLGAGWEEPLPTAA